MNRRQYLAGVGAISAVGLAGCAASGTDGPARVVLTHVELANGTGEPQVFHLVVEHDDEVVHWSSHEVDGGGDGGEMGGAVVEMAPPDEPGVVAVHGRVGETWRTVDFDTDRYDGDRVIAVFQYGPWSDDGTALRGTRLVSDRPASDGESG